MKLEFSKQIFGKKKIKICPVAAELFHADRRTDMTKLTVALRNSTIVLKKYSEYRTACIVRAAKWSEGGRSSQPSVISTGHHGVTFLKTVILRHRLEKPIRDKMWQDLKLPRRDDKAEFVVVIVVVAAVGVVAAVAVVVEVAVIV